MNIPSSSANKLKKLGSVKRQSISVSQDALIKTHYLNAQQLPLVVEPALDGVKLIEWGKENRDYIHTQLFKHGGILFRNFHIDPMKYFFPFIEAISTQILKYQDRATPRHEVSNNVYTSTDYPADQWIELHNENCYAQTWPSKVFFCCVTAAQQGGETPIADSRKVTQRLSPELRERFENKKVMYVRNFGEGFGLSWQSVFQTEDKAQMEEYCRQSNIQVEWKDENRLRTRQVRPATVNHPITGEQSWFNQAMAFHVSTLEKAVQDALLAEHSEEDLPKNALFGDGSSISVSDLEEIRIAHQQETITFPWQEGDILLLDNIMVAHGRAPFVGPRKVIVGMSDPYDWNQVQ